VSHDGLGKVRRKVKRLAARITGGSAAAETATVSVPKPVPARPVRCREAVLRITLPSIPAWTSVLGTGSVGATLVHGIIPAALPLVWPLVVPSLGAMAYDIALRALPPAPADHAAGPGRGPSQPG
jgi:hypothetical protein